MRVVKILCTLVAIGLLGSGCAKLSSLSKSGQESDVDSSAENSGGSDPIDETEKIVTEFMDALVSHDTETVARIGGSQSYSAYGFLDGVVFSGWEFVDSQNDEDGNIYTIKMNISESSEAAFPVGESVWTIEASTGGDEYFSSFIRNGAEEKIILADNVSKLDVSDAVKMCYAFTSEFGWVSSDDSIIDMSGAEKTVEKERFIGDLIKFCSYFSNDEELSGSIVDYSAEKLSESAEKLLGISDLDFTVLPSYNKAKDTVSNKRTKYCWGYAALADEQYDSENGIHRVTIDWYSDTILLAKAKSIDYILLDNPDGSIRLYSTEKTFDNGEPIAFMTRSSY
ncbi:MAG: hypothetical protein ACI4I1_00540 [Oscillospiraceae bacterium]